MAIELKTQPLKIREVIENTADAKTFVFDATSWNDPQFRYKAGQFSTFVFKINDQQVRRSYSFSSAPSSDEFPQITVKRVPQGLVSNWIMDHLKVGDILHATAPAGHFVLNESDKDDLLLFGAGSGVTPLLSLAEEALRTTKRTVRLFLVNRRSSDVLFSDRWPHLEKIYRPRFQSVSVLTENTGRPTEKTIQNAVQVWGSAQSSSAYLCGPEGFMKTVDRALKAQGWSAESIRQEAFFIPTQTESGLNKESTESTRPEGYWIGDATATASQPNQITVLLDGSTQTIAYSENQTILEACLEAGLQPPYSCLDGACMACLAKVDRGAVVQTDLGILTDDAVASKECLTCQARACTKDAVIRFDL